MSRNRNFKQRQANRIDFMIMQEHAADQMRRDQEQAAARLQNQLETLDCGNTNNTVEVGDK